MTTTSTPTPSRTKIRRGTALAAIACTVGVSAGSAVLGAAPAQALGLNSGCQVQIAKVDAATGLPLAGATFKVATADGSASLLTPAQLAQINAQFAQLVAPFAAFNAAITAQGPLSPTAFPFLRDAGGAVPSTTIADVRASLAILTPFASAPSIPASASVGLDTSAGIAFQNATREEVAAEQAFLAANAGVQDLGPTNGLGTAPATNPSPTGAPTITNPTGTGARNPQHAIEVGTNFTLDLNTRPGGMLTLPAGVDFVSATNGALFDPVTRTITNVTGGMAVLTLRGTQPGSVTLQASDVSLPGGPVPAGTFRSGPLTLAFQTPVSAIAPPPAALAFTTSPTGQITPAPGLGAFSDRSLQIVAQVNLPAGPLAAQLAAFKAAVEVPSLTEPTQANGLLNITPAAAVGAATDPSAIVVDSGPALGSTSTVGVVPVVITEVTPPAGFALDTSAGQSIPVGFSACLAPATPPAPGSPAWTITTGPTADGRGTVTTATLRDVLAAVVVPPVVTPPVTTPPVVPPVVTTPPVIPPVVVPPVVTPPVTTPPVIPPVVTTPPVVVVPPVVTTPPVVTPAPVVVPVIPAPVVTTPPVVTPVVPAPVVTPAPVVVPVIPVPVVTPAPAPVAIAVPVTPAPSVARVAPPRGVDAGLAVDQSSGTGQRVLGVLLGLTGLTVAGGLLARRRRQS